MAFEILTQWENMIQLHKIKDFQFKHMQFSPTLFIVPQLWNWKRLKRPPQPHSIVFSWNIAWSFLKIIPPPLSTSFNYRNHSCTMFIIMWVWVNRSPINLSTNSCFKPFQLNFLTLLSFINSKYLLAYLLFVVNG